MTMHRLKSALRCQKLYRIAGKRVLDIVLASVLLLCIAPVLLIVAAIVRIGLGSPVLFRQRRPGLQGKPFTLLKFRTMTVSLDPAGCPLPDADRINGLGRFLRSTSLDELPELINVVRGDMSLVGPRPLLTEYLTRYSPVQSRRHEVRPGITGLAQVNGRNTLSWDEKFAIDVHYVDSLSFAGDLRILLVTVASVVRRSGINRPGHATAPEFLGPES